jgi:hypothetical protein
MKNHDPADLPSRDALAYHKAACLIWRMAGGDEIYDECCEDDDEVDHLTTKEMRLSRTTPLDNDGLRQIQKL